VFVGDERNLPFAISEEAQKFRLARKRIGIMCTSEAASSYALHGDVIRPFGRRGDYAAMASRLFGLFREFDRDGVDVILVEGVPEEGLGFAIMNRLRKAAGGKVIEV